MAEPLSSEAVRQILAVRPAVPGRLLGDDGHQLTGDGAARIPAAVLVGLVSRVDGPAVLLTHRATSLKDHAGQISFPGGRIEPFDAGPAAAAVREAFEEIGLAPDRVEVLGELAPYETVTGFRIHPVVGWVDPPPSFALDPSEVAELFEVPLSFVLDRRNHRRESHERQGRRRTFYAMPYAGHYIWGATAGILVNLVAVLGGE